MRRAMRMLGMAALFAATAAVCAGAVTLQFLTPAWQEDTVTEVENIVAEWNAARPDIQVEIVSVAWENINDYLLTSFQAGQGPDVIHQDTVMCYEYGVQGYAEPLNRYLDAATLADTPQASWDGVSDDQGNIYGVPFLQETLVVFYNKAMFASSGDHSAGRRDGDVGRAAGLRAPTDEDGCERSDDDVGAPGAARTAALVVPCCAKRRPGPRETCRRHVVRRDRPGGTAGDRVLHEPDYGGPRHAAGRPEL